MAGPAESKQPPAPDSASEIRLLSLRAAVKTVVELKLPAQHDTDSVHMHQMLHALQTTQALLKRLDEDVRRASTESAIPKMWEYAVLRPWIMMALFVVLWLIVGTAGAYHALAPPCNAGECTTVTVAMAFYFTVQAGFSVGFGLLTEKADGWRWFTIVHGLLGLTVLSAAATVFLLRPGGALVDILGSPIASDVMDETAEDVINAVEKVSGLDLDGDGDVGEDNSQAKEPGRLRWEVWMVHPPCCVRWVRRLAPFAALLVILAVAIAFEMRYNEWTFTTAAYFAFFAVSTGGLQAPGTHDDAELWFTAGLILVGVPVFGACVGHAVEGILATYTAAQQASETFRRRHPRHHAVLRAAASRGGGSSTVQMPRTNDTGKGRQATTVRTRVVPSPSASGVDA